MNDELIGYDAIGLSEFIRKGEIKPVALLEITIQRNAFSSSSSTRANKALGKALASHICIPIREQVNNSIRD